MGEAPMPRYRPWYDRNIARHELSRSDIGLRRHNLEATRMTVENVMAFHRVNEFADDDLRLYAQGGDAQAFERLTRRYVHIVYTFCVRQLADAHLAEDVTQAVFILLAQKAGSLRPGVVL